MIGKLKQNLLVACLVISSVTVFYLGRHAMECHHRIEERSQPGGILPLSALGGSMRTTLRTGQNLSTPFVYNKDMPLIFIGGVPRSGTTLMRAMLDAHPEVRCGEETRVIPRILAMKQMWSRSGREKMRLDEAGVTDEVLDAAMQAFLLEIIVKHGEPANFLCNKDPFALKSLSYLAKIFPRAKFVLMIRDGRASVHSMISRKVTIAGFDLGSYRDCLTKWNRAIETMYTQCLEATDKCLPVHYEQLVLHPEKWMRTLLKFLDIPWSDAVLHHEELIGKAGGVSLSKFWSILIQRHTFSLNGFDTHYWKRRPTTSSLEGSATAFYHHKHFAPPPLKYFARSALKSTPMTPGRKKPLAHCNHHHRVSIYMKISISGQPGPRAGPCLSININ
uniref:Protein-tyrosine sulfotransferase n=1 Tax=Amphiprion ocellaris TaxID=80972 RepID=A0AAQ5YLJ3_AMPOC